MKNIVGVVLALALFSSCFQAEPSKLKTLLDKKGIYLGAAVMPNYLNEGDYARTLESNFNYITPENNLKWEAIASKEGQFDFSGGDAILKWSQDRKMPMRGHNLLWHIYNPNWLEQKTGTREEMSALMKSYIQTVVGHYKGKIRDWDVINEPINEHGKLRTDSIWYKTIGPDYIELAFQYAHEADPEARLFVNDYFTETINTKSDALLKLVQDWKKKGVPVHGIGFQFHVDAMVPFDFASAAQNMKRFQELGLAIQFTEVDLRLAVPSDEKSRERQAKMAGDLMRLGLSTKGFDAFITWGVSNKYSWIPGFFSGYGDGLLFDEKYKPTAMVAALEAALEDPEVGPAWLDKIVADGSFGRTVPPFRAVEAKKEPKMDGEYRPEEWAGAYVYPFSFNQLDPVDFRGYLDEDFFCTWRVVFKGNKIYGLVSRKDDKNVLSRTNSYENDNLEVFFKAGNAWAQYRAVLGSDWENAEATGGKVVWSKKRDFVQFSLTVPVDSLKGKTIAWLTAISDNDNGSTPRTRQTYPVVGANTGWQGKGFAELTFEDSGGKFLPGDIVGEVPPFIASSLKEKPILDAKFQEKFWKNVSIYPLSYNQFGGKDQTPPATKTLSASWSAAWMGQTLYGRLLVDSEQALAQNAFRLFLSTSRGVETAVFKPGSQATTEDGKPIEGVSVVWSSDNKAAEWSWDVSADTIGAFKAGKRIPINVSYGDDKVQLFAIPGYSFENRGTKDLSVQMSQSSLEMCTLVLE